MDSKAFFFEKFKLFSYISSKLKFLSSIRLVECHRLNKEFLTHSHSLNSVPRRENNSHLVPILLPHASAYSLRANIANPRADNATPRPCRSMSRILVKPALSLYI